MKKLFISALFAAGVLSLAAQNFDLNLNSSWSANPVLHNVPKPFDSSGAVGILDERRIEYATEKNNTFIIERDHFIIKLMNDNGIENFNKIYIPVRNDAEILSIQARTISTDGKVIQLDTTKIKETEENNQKYKLFALDGLEKGAEVEYAYTIKRVLSLFGSETFQRSSMPCLHAKFTLISPTYLKFDAKGYNGFIVSKDSVIGEQRVIAGYSDNIEEMEDEKYAETDPHLQRVDYKLSYNLDQNANVRLYTWKEFAKKSFDYYSTRTSKEDKAVDGLISKIKISSNANDEQKILTVEDYLKTNYNIDKDITSDDAENIEPIIKNKAANETGIVRLFAAIFDKLAINYQFVFPGTRTGYTIDKDLESWNRVDDVIFYFPQTGKYMSPATVDLRYPFIPYEFTATLSLFLKSTVIGDFKTAIGVFDTIPSPSFDMNALNVEAAIHFSDDLDTAVIHLKQIYKGYGAEGYRPIYNFLTPDKQDKANKEIIKGQIASDDISNIKIENSAFTDYFDNKPLIISADLKNAELIERAGNKLLFKVGAIIGPQEQMYQEKPRHLPVELPFPHVLNRTITLTIPDGYAVKNLDELNMNVAYQQSGITTMGFVSSYKQDGNVITIQVNETYHQINYPLSEFENFKKVINASADFNKVTLVLEKK